MAKSAPLPLRLSKSSGWIKHGNQPFVLPQRYNSRTRPAVRPSHSDRPRARFKVLLRCRLSVRSFYGDCSPVKPRLTALASGAITDPDRRTKSPCSFSVITLKIGPWDASLGREIYLHRKSRGSFQPFCDPAHLTQPNQRISSPDVSYPFMTRALPGCARVLVNRDHFFTQPDAGLAGGARVRCDLANGLCEAGKVSAIR